MDEALETTQPQTFRQRVGEWIEGAWARNVIVTLIVLNAITLGLETSPTAVAYAGGFLRGVEHFVLGVFVVEMIVKLYAFGPRFFRSGWNVFDIFIIGVSLVPGSGPFSILRSLRILRILRLLSTIGRLRMIIESLLAAIPSIGWIVFLLVLVFYIFGVMGTQLFGATFPDWFGSVGASMYTLFQVMTLESWSMGIARPVMEAYPHAYLYFIPFILISSLTILNVFIGIIVNTMQALHWEEEDEKRAAAEARAHAEREEMLAHLRRLSVQVEQLQSRLAEQPDSGRRPD
ncbi:voltage-gated sodium channel [Alkalilimnicola ehrlichii]|uniref:Voltage-gated sodium channel n=1 Tax=Alkalilimnicola ehrlichii TaxID=351052 RepID=A0A3E0WUA7_9GAMM|nr:ion transporter [Alkalilimnicola ehrlichii]RFA29830.1 voltage-gated sodium channel [Alkalilimnicola ehrlichii]RFA36418.1 voltage-gated sodium channel [Alkalilimnicola ehrlichii]